MKTNSGRRYISITDKMVDYMKRCEKTNFTETVGDNFFLGSVDITKEVINNLKHANIGIFEDKKDLCNKVFSKT